MNFSERTDRLDEAKGLVRVLMPVSAPERHTADLLDWLIAELVAVRAARDPQFIEQTLQHHLPVTFDDGGVLCLCGKTFEGPVFQRRHVAALIAAGSMCEPLCTHPAHNDYDEPLAAAGSPTPGGPE